MLMGVCQVVLDWPLGQTTYTGGETQGQHHPRAIPFWLLDWPLGCSAGMALSCSTWGKIDVLKPQLGFFNVFVM